MRVNIRDLPNLENAFLFDCVIDHIPDGLIELALTNCNFTHLPDVAYLRITNSPIGIPAEQLNNRARVILHEVTIYGQLTTPILELKGYHCAFVQQLLTYTGFDDVTIEETPNLTLDQPLHITRLQIAECPNLSIQTAVHINTLRILYCSISSFKLTGSIGRLILQHLNLQKLNTTAIQNDLRIYSCRDLTTLTDERKTANYVYKFCYCRSLTALKFPFGVSGVTEGCYWLYPEQQQLTRLTQLQTWSRTTTKRRHIRKTRELNKYLHTDVARFVAEF
jgi:hypothetical protein